MATKRADPPTAAKQTEASTVAGTVKGLAGLLVIAAVGVGIAALLVDHDGGDDVPPPTAQERGDTVSILQRSSASQGICYGWVLQDFYGPRDLSVGSNLGEGVAVEENASCPRWVQVVAQVAYTSESSESNDFALIRVESSEGVPGIVRDRIRNGLDRLGLTEEAFVDEPGWAVTRAAVSLPLLAAEAGLVEPAPTPAAGAASPVPLPQAGSDLWRDRWGQLLAATGLLLFAALLVAVGFWQRGRQRRKEAEQQEQGAARMKGFRAARQAAAPDRGRTPEER